MHTSASAVYEFGEFVLDLGLGALTAKGAARALRPKSFALLGHPVQSAGRVVDRDEIMNAVWPGVFVTDDSIAQGIRDIRRALADSEQHLIRTVPRRGYLFAAQVRRVGAIAEGFLPDGSAVVGVLSRGGQATSDAPGGSAAATNPAGQASFDDKPSVAVLRFQNLSTEAAQDYFADGMVSEIITALSRIGWLRVIAHNALSNAQASDVTQVGRELAVRYVLQGSVRRDGDRVRITAQLTETETGAHLWADRFDGRLDDVFEFQDNVALGVAGIIEPTLVAAETARSAGRRTSDLTAYDLYLRAYAMILSSARDVPEALRLLEQAITRDPHYGPALGWAGYCSLRLVTDGRSQAPALDREQGAAFAHRALQVSGHDPDIVAIAAFTLAYLGEDMDAMLALIDRALAQRPSFARGWNVSGALRCLAGQPDIGIEHLEMALRLSPRARVGRPMIHIGIAHFISRRFEQAIPKLLVAIHEDPSYPGPYRYLAACYAHLGQLDEARNVIDQLSEVTSLLIPDASFLRNPEHRQLFLSGLSLAVDAAK